MFTSPIRQKQWLLFLFNYAIQRRPWGLWVSAVKTQCLPKKSWFFKSLADILTQRHSHAAGRTSGLIEDQDLCMPNISQNTWRHFLPRETVDHILVGNLVSLPFPPFPPRTHTHKSLPNLVNTVSPPHSSINLSAWDRRPRGPTNSGFSPIIRIFTYLYSLYLEHKIIIIEMYHIINAISFSMFKSVKCLSVTGLSVIWG